MTNKDKIVHGIESVIKSVVNISNIIPLGRERVRVSLSNSYSLAKLHNLFLMNGIASKCTTYMSEDPFALDFDYPNPMEIIDLIQEKIVPLT